jgi:hypothetical protein
MKKLFLSVFFIPFAGTAGLQRIPSLSTTHLAEVRSGEWPMDLERDVDRRDTSYSLIFRDQHVEDVVVMDTLAFPNLQQLKYLGQALTVLKSGHNGDIANFSNYSIKRADKKFDGVWYILRDKYGLTDFQQPEADIMCKTIKGL